MSDNSVVKRFRHRAALRQVSFVSVRFSTLSFLTDNLLEERERLPESKQWISLLSSFCLRWILRHFLLRSRFEKNFYHPRQSWSPRMQLVGSMSRHTTRLQAQEIVLLLCRTALHPEQGI